MFHESKTDLGSRRLCLKEGPFFLKDFSSKFDLKKRKKEKENEKEGIMVA